MSEEISTCCCCGYSWKTGTDGSHSCSSQLQKKLNKYVYGEVEIFKKGKWYWGGLASEGDLWVPLSCPEDGKLKTLNDGRIYTPEEISGMTIREAMLPKHC